VTPEFEKRAVCQCGQTYRAPFGKIFHVWEECCSVCGADKSTFKIEVGQHVRGVWIQRVEGVRIENVQDVEPESILFPLICVAVIFGVGVAAGLVL